MKTREREVATGEVFTPPELIQEMLNQLNPSVWSDGKKTWLEPSAGDGNFLVVIRDKLLEAGHELKHILDNMLFSIELIDDNHWILQHRLGYLKDGLPNTDIWTPEEIGEWWNLESTGKFRIATIDVAAQEVNQHNPYQKNLGLERDQVLHHINHVCTSALSYDMSFSRMTSECTSTTLVFT